MAGQEIDIDGNDPDDGLDGSGKRDQMTSASKPRRLFLG